ncbi:MAG: hypothetical protein ACQESB_06035, partial [Elusimicrobiota bacterium]
RALRKEDSKITDRTNVAQGRTYDLRPVLKESQKEVKSGYENKIVLSWQGGDNSFFNIYRKMYGKGEYGIIAREHKGHRGGGLYEYEDKDVRPGSVYMYKIHSVNSSGAENPEYALIKGRAAFKKSYLPQRRFVTPNNIDEGISFGQGLKEVVIFDPRGREVSKLRYGEGSDIVWRPGDSSHVRGRISSGLYIYRLLTEEGDYRYGTVAVAR